MTDYKTTLNLPHTDFPMKASLPNREPKQLKKWQDIDLYDKITQAGSGRPTFILHDGPPYASGRPHMGTAMNKVIKDIIVKSRRLSGYYAPFIPGWDCHGLPIELNVEKKHGKPGDKLDARAFRQECRKYAQKQVDIQSEDFQRLGVLADWKKPYVSMDYTFEANAVRALREIVANDHLQRGYKPVHWCFACGSALAEAEVEYQDKTSPAIDVGFAVTDANAVSACFDCPTLSTRILLPIWTTTPWTLPANEAVCVHPNVPYVLLKVTLNEEACALIVAEALAPSVLARYGIDTHQVLGTVPGKALQTLRCQHPLEDRQVPVIIGEHVTTDAGTGNVHTAPAHGVDDYHIGQQFDLPNYCRVDGRGVFIEAIEPIMGQHVFKANPIIINRLTENGSLLHHTPFQHSYPHCWRHKTPLIFRATPQWFISMTKNKLAEQAQAAIAKTHWIPSWGQARLDGMISGRPDWCISRQRAWGIPITLLVHEKTGECHPDTLSIMDQAANRIEQDGINAWYDFPIESFTDQSVEGYQKVTDILDVWFDAGVTHYCVVNQRPELTFPADLYFEGSDQHRGWFQTSLLTSIAMYGKTPYKTVLTHGYVVDGNGRKMSKSLGNGMYPADVVKQLGADVLRLWAAASNHTDDMTVSNEILKRSADAYRRMRNTTRFLLGNLSDFTPADAIPFDQLVALDLWILQQTKTLQTELLAAYENYALPKVFQLLHNFCTVTLGNFYLDIIKDRLYTAAKKGAARRSAQTALFHILQSLVRWLAPILSYTAEEIWTHMAETDQDSVFLTEWHSGLDSLPDIDTKIDWSHLSSLRDQVNKALESARKQKHIGGALDANVTIYAGQANVDHLKTLQDELRFFCLTSAATVVRDDQQSNGECRIEVEVITGDKCERCWQRRQDVGQHQEHPHLCSRCISNITQTDGEQRHWC